MKKSYAILGIIFLLVFGIRLFFAFQIDGFLSDESYFHIRQVNNILETGAPLYQDNLLSEGRVFIFSPLFDYIFAFFSFFIPVEMAGKILSNFFAACLVLAIYFIVRFLTKNEHVSLVSSLIAGFIPIFLGETFASLSVYPLVFTLFLFLIYLYLQLPSQLNWFIVGLFFLVFLHPISVLFIFGLCLYHFLIFIEGLHTEKWEFEVLLFALFLGLWGHFLFYKDALFAYGPAVIWQNIPGSMLSTYFAEVSLIQILLLIGLVPFVCGIYTIWRYLFRKKEKQIYILISYTLLVSFLLWLKLIPLKAGMMLLAIFFVLLFSQFYAAFLNYCKRTRVAKHMFLVKTAIVLVFVLTSVFPSIVYSNQVVEDSFVEEEIASLLWLAENTKEDTVVFALPQEGNLIEAIAQRNPVLDTQFLSIPNAEERYADIITFFTTPSRLQAIKILNKYNADYVYYSPRARRLYGEFSFVSPRCFVPIYEKDAIIYKSKCEVEEIA